MIDSVTGVFQWSLPASISEHRLLQDDVTVTDQAWPFLSDTRPIFLDVVPFRVRIGQSFDDLHAVIWDAIPGQGYEIQVKTNLFSGEWKAEMDPLIIPDY